MKKYLILIPVTLFFISTNSQNNNFLLNMKIGNAVLESKNELKINSNIIEIEGLYRIKNFEKKSFLIGVQFTSLNSSFFFDGQSRFLNNKYINLPFKYQIFKSVMNEKANVFFSSGIYTSYLFNSSEQIISTNFEKNTNNLNLSFGFEVNLGLRLKITDSTYCNLSLDSKSDLFRIYQVDNNKEYKITNFYTASFGFEFEI